MRSTRSRAHHAHVTLRRTLTLTGVALAAVAGTGALAVRDAGGVQRAAVTVDVAHPGPTVPASFVGFSLEVPAAAAYAGTAAHPNGALTRLLATLGAAQGRRSRCASGATRPTSPRGLPQRRRAPGRVRAAPGSCSALTGSGGCRGSRARRERRSPSASTSPPATPAARWPLLARSGRRCRRGALRTVEIGNEPDLYTRGVAFRSGRVVVRRIARRASYDQARYMADVSRYAGVLSAGLGRDPALAAGGFGGVAWDAALAPLLRGEQGRVGALSAHAYPLDGCPGHARRAVQLHRLLSDTAARGLAAGVARMVAIGRTAGVPVHVTEMNSATCGGFPGISDTFASALWVPGALFAMARAGAAGVDIHSWPLAPYAPFAFAPGRGGAPRAQARPLYYGLLLFADAAGHGSRLLPTQVSTDSGVRVWATLTRTGTLHVVAVNPSSSNAARVTVAPRGAGARPATLRFMRAPGLRARRGVSLAGRAIGADGRLHGRYRAVTVVPVAGAGSSPCRPPAPACSARHHGSTVAASDSTKHAPEPASTTCRSPSICSASWRPIASPSPKPAPLGAAAALEALEDQLALVVGDAGPVVADDDAASPSGRARTR